MSRTEGSLIHDVQNASTKTGARNPQSAVRRKLADISNLPQNQRQLNRENKSKFIETTRKEYIDQLQKENMDLVNMLAQRNKTIEQSGIELQMLRLNLHKMHDQNQQLALSNSLMLAELNSSKDRLKVLQHKLGCKSGLLNARKMEHEDKETIPCKNADTEFITSVEKVKVDGDPQKSKNSSQSDNSFEQAKETALYRRTCARRQSARYKAAELKPADDLFVTDDTKVHACPLPDDTVPENGPISEIPLSENEHYDRNSRGEFSRPSREAAKKVQSYKERPINVKMRRPV